MYYVEVVRIQNHIFKIVGLFYKTFWAPFLILKNWGKSQNIES